MAWRGGTACLPLLVSGQGWQGEQLIKSGHWVENRNDHITSRPGHSAARMTPSKISDHVQIGGYLGAPGGLQWTEPWLTLRGRTAWRSNLLWLCLLGMSVTPAYYSHSWPIYWHRDYFTWSMKVELRVIGSHSKEATSPSIFFQVFWLNNKANREVSI